MTRFQHRRRFLATTVAVLASQFVRDTSAGQADWVETYQLRSKLVSLQNEDGSWGAPPRNNPEEQRRLTPETTALLMLAMVNGPLSIGLVTTGRTSSPPGSSAWYKSLERGFTYLARAARELCRRETLDDQDERLLALTSLALLEEREPPVDEDRDMEEEAAGRWIGESLVARLRGGTLTSTAAWQFLVLAAGARKGVVTARQAFGAAKRVILARNELLAVDRPWAWLLFALASDDRPKLLAETDRRVRRADWVESFDDAFFCTVAYDRVACLFESTRSGRVSEQLAWVGRTMIDGPRALYGRPDWTRWQVAVEAGVFGDPPAMLRRDRDADVGLSLPADWQSIRLNAKRLVLLQSLFARRSWSSGQVER